MHHANDWGFLDKIRSRYPSCKKNPATVPFPDEIESLWNQRKRTEAPYLKSVVIIALFTGFKKKELLN
jgi:hypothetical protein